MRPESDPARQRTVAELLAQHGGVDTAVRRRRRRDDPDSDAADAADGSAPPEPATVRDLVPPGRRGTPTATSSPTTPPRPGGPVPSTGSVPRPRPPRPSPPAENGVGATARLGSMAHGSSRRLPGPPSGPGPITREPRRDRPYLPNAMRQGPGVPPPVVRSGVPWAPPAGPGARRDAPDPGPATGAWKPFADDDGNGGEAGDVGSATVPGSPAVPPGGPGPARAPVAPGPPPVRNEPPVDEHPDDDDPVLDEYDDVLPEALDGPSPPLARSWAGVVAQWLTGAVVGAVLWVLFRYLWRGLPVVALAAALLVTAGLVVGVRQLLHDVDRRTTAFAVLVGLLLTASPAVLVLLGR